MRSESPSLIPTAPEEDAANQKSIAGRKKVTGGEKWDKFTGKESVMVGDRIAGAKDAKTAALETKEDHEVEVELNSILKKGPSQCTPPPFSIQHGGLALNSKVKTLTSFRLCSSHYLLQNLLPAFQKGQIHPPL